MQKGQMNQRTTEEIPQTKRKPDKDHKKPIHSEKLRYKNADNVYE
ncbi:hypothetical protein QNH23_06895 [Siminovitchia fortis]|nr:hypothetical protein [Siminovitchia fortis]WHY83096.1 hypothetical protein QNH23_06895 [Siminovitchia fortis]